MSSNQNNQYPYLVLVAVLLLISYTPSKLYSQASYASASKELFAELYGSKQTLVIFVRSGTSCTKCAILAKSMAGAIESYNVPTVDVLMLNRLCDSTAYKDDLNDGRWVYQSRLMHDRWTPNLNEDAWYYYNKDSSDLVFCSLTAPGSKEMLVNLCIQGSIQHMGIKRKKLCILDESDGTLLVPSFNSYIHDSVVVVGSDKSIKLDAFNIYSGKRIWEAAFADSQFTCALYPGEVLERKDMLLSPGMIATEWVNEDTVLIVGSIVSRRYDSVRMAPMIGRRDFISLINSKKNSIIWSTPPRNLNLEIAQISMTNSKLRYPYLYTSQCPWDISEDSIYSINSVRRIHLQTGEFQEMSYIDSTYRILGIGKNLWSGLFCIQNFCMWTCQPLSPYLENQVTHEKLWLTGEWYNGYYRNMINMADLISDFDGSAFQRYKQYNIRSIVAGIFAFGVDCIAVMAYERNEGAKAVEHLYVYSVPNREQVASLALVPGWTMQKEDNSIVRIELSGEQYEVVQYTWEQ